MILYAIKSPAGTSCIPPTNETDVLGIVLPVNESAHAYWFQSFGASSKLSSKSSRKSPLSSARQSVQITVFLLHFLSGPLHVIPRIFKT